MPLVSFIYVTTNVAYFTLLSPAEFLETNAVAVVSILKVNLKMQLKGGRSC